MAFNTAHLIETALLLLTAYLLGCVLGYGIRRILYAARGTRQVAALVVPEKKRMPSPAARLAARVDEPLQPVSKPREAAHANDAALLTATRPASTPRSADARPSPLLAPRGGIADNLKQIKGIGPKIEASLNGLGIFHFDQIAGWSKANIDWVDGQLAFKGRIRRERWVEQARDMVRAAA